MRWTSEPPSSVGWWWRKLAGASDPIPILVLGEFDAAYRKAYLWSSEPIAEPASSEQIDETYLAHLIGLDQDELDEAVAEATAAWFGEPDALRRALR